MNKDVDELTCLLDGKITAFRMKHGDAGLVFHHNLDIIRIQRSIQALYDDNKKRGV